MRANLNNYLASLHPGAWWNWIDVSAGEIYENVQVLDDTKTLPSKEECEAGIIALQAEWDARLIDQQKQNAYQSESDPLFFKYQAGEATEQEWLDKRNEIKARFS
jgi:hypothetical protein